MDKSDKILLYFMSISWSIIIFAAFVWPYLIKEQ
jgi:hypothetical protein